MFRDGIIKGFRSDQIRSDVWFNVTTFLKLSKGERVQQNRPNILMQIMNMSGYVLSWYPLGIKVTMGQAHKTGSWYLLADSLKKRQAPSPSCHFYIGVTPPGNGQSRLTEKLPNCGPQCVLVMRCFRVDIIYSSHNWCDLPLYIHKSFRLSYHKPFN